MPRTEIESESACKKPGTFLFFLCMSLAVEIMSYELALDDIVTEFMLNTCRLCPQSKSIHAVYAALYSGIIANNFIQPDKECMTDTDLINIPLTTGSVAEFYIEPMFTGWAVAQTCCISQCSKYRKSGIFGYPWEQNP